MDFPLSGFQRKILFGDPKRSTGMKYRPVLVLVPLPFRKCRLNNTGGAWVVRIGRPTDRQTDQSTDRPIYRRAAFRGPSLHQKFAARFHPRCSLIPSYLKVTHMRVVSFSSVFFLRRFSIQAYTDWAKKAGDTSGCCACVVAIRGSVLCAANVG